MNEDFTPDQNGVIIGPLCFGKSAEETAKNVFKLLTTLGIKCSDISRVYINQKASYAKIEVYKADCEDYLMKVLRVVPLKLKLNDLKVLFDNPERLLVERIRNDNRNKGKEAISDGSTSTGRPTAVENKPPSSLSKRPKTTQPSSILRALDSIVGASFASDSCSTVSATVSPLKTEKDEGLQILQNEATSTSDILSFCETQNTTSVSESAEKPIMISAKTSTPIVYPCGCPETVFYLKLQEIGTETRYAEFKKGGAIHEQRVFQSLVAKYVCGFLNSEGGTLYFGVNDDGIVVGIPVDKNLEESLRLDIDFAVRLIQPRVDQYEYSVNFARVMETDGEFSADLKILEICVKPRTPPARQYSYNDVTYMRRDGSLQALHRANTHTDSSP